MAEKAISEACCCQLQRMKGCVFEHALASIHPPELFPMLNGHDTLWHAAFLILQCIFVVDRGTLMYSIAVLQCDHDAAI